jgi:hypothetical protein
MADEALADALQDPVEFRRYIEARLTDAMREAIREMHQEEDDLVIWGDAGRE